MGRFPEGEIGEAHRHLLWQVVAEQDSASGDIPGASVGCRGLLGSRCLR